ncbi:MAG: GNAT family N-acetyltransferase [Candidatus Saccharimonas sp.]
MKIREIEKTDIPRVADLLKEAWVSFSKKTDFVDDHRFDNSNAQEWLEKLVESDGNCFVATENDVLMGAITFSVKDSHIFCHPKHVYIWDVIVSQDARRKGVGLALEKEVEKYAVAHSIHLIIGEIWAYNDASRNMMKKLGRTMMYEVWGKEL